VEQDTKISRGAGADETERAVRERVDALEAGFGPVDDPDNPLGREALLAADEHWEVLAGSTRSAGSCGRSSAAIPRSASATCWPATSRPRPSGSRARPPSGGGSPNC
jgi:hypothetical protein